MRNHVTLPLHANLRLCKILSFFFSSFFFFVVLSFLRFVDHVEAIRTKLWKRNSFQSPGMRWDALDRVRFGDASVGVGRNDRSSVEAKVAAAAAANGC